MSQILIWDIFFRFKMNFHIGYFIISQQKHSDSTPYRDFQKRFKLLAQKKPFLVENTLSNIFTMRLIGNKTYGDLAEIGLAEFIHQFMYDFDSRHVGKDLFRAKEHEEDIVIINVSYFESLTNGWLSYVHNLILVQLFRLALNSTENGHKSANVILQTDIDNLKGQK